MRPTQASLRGREDPRKEVMGFLGERGLGSVRGRKGSQTGEVGLSQWGGSRFSVCEDVMAFSKAGWGGEGRVPGWL